MAVPTAMIGIAMGKSVIGMVAMLVATWCNKRVKHQCSTGSLVFGSGHWLLGFIVGITWLPLDECHCEEWTQGSGTQCLFSQKRWVFPNFAGQSGTVSPCSYSILEVLSSIVSFHSISFHLSISFITFWLVKLCIDWLYIHWYKTVHYIYMYTVCSSCVSILIFSTNEYNNQSYNEYINTW